MRVVMFGLGLVLVVGASAFEANRAAEAADFAVTADNFLFAPAARTISTGDSVTWTFADTFPHNVVADGGAFTSGAQQVGGTYQFTFANAGTYAYYCAVHGGPGGVGMSGTITVQQAATATATTSAPTASATAGSATATPTRTATGTPQATATPGTATVTPVATSTAPPVATSTPVVVVPISAQDPAGGSGPAVTVPAVGTGDGSGGGSPHAVSIMLGALGVAMVGGAMLVRRRAT